LKQQQQNKNDLKQQQQNKKDLKRQPQIRITHC
jgi:hypothetical protein